MKTTEELRKELREAEEREGIEKRVKEYERLRKIVSDVGDLSYDEVIMITTSMCNARGVFDTRQGW